MYIHAARVPPASDEFGRPYRSFRGLLGYLSTLTRNEPGLAGCRRSRHGPPLRTEPVGAQRRTFELIATPIPLALRK